MKHSMVCSVVYWLLVDAICGGGLSGEWPRYVTRRIGALTGSAWSRPTSQTRPPRNPPISTARTVGLDGKTRLHRTVPSKTSKRERTATQTSWSPGLAAVVVFRDLCSMLPYQAVAMDYAVSSGFQRQTPIGLGVNINPAFTHSWFVPADLCVPYKQSPLLEPGHVILIISELQLGFVLFCVFVVVVFTPFYEFKQGTTIITQLLV